MNKLELIKKHEGLRLKPYQCTAGKATIGFGRNIEDNGIRLDEAELMLSNDIKECEAVLSDRMEYWDALSEVRQAVLIDMMYNLGWPRLSKFKRTLAAVNDGYFDRAAAEMLDSRWARQVGQRAMELSDMMQSNKW